MAASVPSPQLPVSGKSCAAASVPSSLRIGDSLLSEPPAFLFHGRLGLMLASVFLCTMGLVFHLARDLRDLDSLVVVTAH